MSKSIQRETEKCLIILRGVTASGKTQISKALRKKNPDHYFELDLDQYS